MARLPDGADLDTALLLAAAPAVLLPALMRRRPGRARRRAGCRRSVMPRTCCACCGDDRAATAHGDGARHLSRHRLDHGLNASTFAARVVASTQAGLNSSVLAALGALKGPLHGGAPGPVLDMLDAIGTPENADAGSSDELERAAADGLRAPHLSRARSARGCAEGGARPAGEIRQRSTPRAWRWRRHVETAALAALKRHKPDRPLATNVEFYTALLLEALGFPRETFTAVFAVGRVGGWIAHAREQAATGRLIRPKSLYVGPAESGAA